MRTYYRGPDALVTDEHFVWRTATPRIFAVRELRNVGLVRDDVVDRRPDVAMVAAAGMAAHRDCLDAGRRRCRQALGLLAIVASRWPSPPVSAGRFACGSFARPTAAST